MIIEAIRLLQSSHFFGESDNIEFAKGKFSIPKTTKEFNYKLKRKWLTKRT